MAIRAKEPMTYESSSSGYRRRRAGPDKSMPAQTVTQPPKVSTWLLGGKSWTRTYDHMISERHAWRHQQEAVMGDITGLVPNMDLDWEQVQTLYKN